MLLPPESSPAGRWPVSSGFASTTAISSTKLVTSLTQPTPSLPQSSSPPPTAPHHNSTTPHHVSPAAPPSPSRRPWPAPQQASWSCLKGPAGPVCSHCCHPAFFAKFPSSCFRLFVFPFNSVKNSFVYTVKIHPVSKKEDLITN